MKQIPVFKLLDRYFFDASPFTIFGHRKIDLIFKVWETVLLNRSLLIFADSPDLSSEAVFVAISLIFPIVHVGEIHPYFTIFDQKFNALKSSKLADKNVMLGVTNPLFRKSMDCISVSLHLDQEMDKILQQKHGEDVSVKKYLVCKQKPMIRSSNKLSNLLTLGNSVEAVKINNEIIKKRLLELTLSFIEVFYLYFQKQANVHSKGPEDSRRKRTARLHPSLQAVHRFVLQGEVGPL